MKSFLITYKPDTENPELGWPLHELQRLVSSHRAGRQVIEAWRFHNRTEVALGDRVFLLLQGRLGPAIIGYGEIVGEPENTTGKWQAQVKFESIVDPSLEVLASKEDLFAIDGGRRFWRTQASGIHLEESIARELEALDLSPKPRVRESTSNPDWSRDEWLVALDFYLQHRPNLPSKGSEEIRELSRLVNRVGEKLFRPEGRADTFRYENSVYRKLMNFRGLDSQYTTERKVGQTGGAKADEEVWTEFAGDAARCRQVSEAIIASLDDPEVDTGWLQPSIDEGLQEAAEGRLLTRKHVTRERNSGLVKSKLKQAMKRDGKLVCEVCDFDFAKRYGARGTGFIECHHTKPVATLTEGQKTHINDLALVCANCHRMIHRGKRWLSVEEVRILMRNLPLEGDAVS